MKNIATMLNKKTIGLVLILSMLVSFSSFTQNHSIKFEEKWGTEILTKAKQGNKLIFVDAYTTWCGPCKWLAANVFTNDTVADFFNSNFICVRLDAEKPENLEFSKKYSIEAYPTLLYINSHEETAHRTVGAKPAKLLLEDAIIALNPDKNLLSFQKKYEAGELSSQFIFDYLNVCSSAGTGTKNILEKYFKTQPDINLTSAINKKIIYNFINDAGSREFNFMLKNQALFDSIATRQPISDKIFEIYMNSFNVVFYSKKFDVKKFDSLKTVVNNSGFIRSEEILFNASLTRCQIQKDWKNYATLAFDNVDKYYNKDAMTLNNIAWVFFENISDKKMLEKALEWAKQSVTLNHQGFNLDTYANLLFKTGKVSDAIIEEEEAISLYKKAGEPCTELEESLRKMKEKTK